MRHIVHHRLGAPADVLTLADAAEPAVGPNMVLVRVTHAPIHPGDLLGIEGSPAFGTPPAIPTAGRVPGFEGAGVVERLGPDCDPALAISVGDKVVFFPAGDVWSDRVAVSATSIVKLPASVASEIGAQMLINTITARVLVREGLALLGDTSTPGDVVLQTGAASATGRLLTTLLVEAGITPLRIVESRASAALLAQLHPSVVVIAAEDPRWRNQLRDALGGRVSKLAYDSVGGNMIAEIGAFLTQGATILNYGSLGGQWTDIRAIVPRRQSVRGISFTQWSDEPEDVRTSDIAKALDLVVRSPGLFEVAGEYDPTDIADAVAHVHQRGKVGTVMLRFS